MNHALGIDIGGTKIAAGLVGPDGAVLGLNRTPTPALDGPDAIIAAAVRCARVALTAHPSGAVVACGIGTAGTVGPAGSITHATASLPGWAGTDVADLAAAALGVPVHVLNDVHATALGESRYGAAAGSRSALVVAVGTGIGAGFVNDGSVVTGASGLAGSLGHMVVAAPVPRRCPCGGWNHVEAHAAGPAIEERYAEVTGQRCSLPAIAALARGGNQAARDVITLAAQHLGWAIGEAATLLNPGMVVIAGGVAALADMLAEPIQQALGAAGMPGMPAARLCFSTLGTTAAIIGAASAARERKDGLCRWR